MRVIRNDDDIVFASDPEDGQGVSGGSVPFWEGAAPRKATYEGARWEWGQIALQDTFARWDPRSAKRYWETVSAT